MHEPDPQRGRGVEALAGEEVAPRRARADLGERERRDHGRDDPELHLREREDGLLVRDDDVRAGHQPGAAAERVTLHARDDGRGTAVDRLEHAAQRVRVRDVGVVVEGDRGAHPVDVGTGAEARAFAGQHDRARLADVDERFRELGDQLRVERVARLRPRQRDEQEVVVTFDLERAHRAEILTERPDSLTSFGRGANTAVVRFAGHFGRG